MAHLAHLALDVAAVHLLRRLLHARVHLLVCLLSPVLRAVM